MLHRWFIRALAPLACVLIATSALALPPSHSGSQRKRVVVMVGLPGSGKTELSKSLSRATGAPRHTCGDVVRGWVKAQGLPYTPKNDRMASQHFAKRPGTLAQQMVPQIANSSAQLHIIDGVRSVADMKVLKQNFDVKVVALKVTPRSERYRRMLARKRFANETTSYLKKRDRREIGLGVLHVLRNPFKRVDNSGPITAIPSIAKQLAADLDKAW